MELNSVNTSPLSADLMLGFVSRGYCCKEGGRGQSRGGEALEEKEASLSDSPVLISLGPCRVCGSFQQCPVANNKWQLPPVHLFLDGFMERCAAGIAPSRKWLLWARCGEF